MAEEKHVEQELTVNDLVDALELVDIKTYQLYGVIDAGFGSIEGIADPPDDPNSMNLNTSPAIRVAEDGVEVRQRLTLRGTGVLIQIDVGALYRLQRTLAVTEALAHEFAARVALMTVWPFVRQHVADLSSRLSDIDQIVLPLLRPDQNGDVTVRLENGPRPQEDPVLDQPGDDAP